MFNQLFKYHGYNIHVANMLGLNSAVYLSAVLSNVDEDTDEVVVDRDKIYHITTLDSTAQHNLDSTFSKLNVFNVESENKIHINFPALLALYNEDNKDAIAEIIPKVTKKRTKADVIKDELKSYIKTTNGELRDAYASWIDAVYAKQGWMSKKSVELGQKLIDTYSNRNLDIAIELLNIASIGGYRDIQWAINSYEDNLKKRMKATSSIVLNNNSEVKKPVELNYEDIF